LSVEDLNQQNSDEDEQEDWGPSLLEKVVHWTLGAQVLETGQRDILGDDQLVSARQMQEQAVGQGLRLAHLPKQGLAWLLALDLHQLSRQFVLFGEHQVIEQVLGVDDLGSSILVVDYNGVLDCLDVGDLTLGSGRKDLPQEYTTLLLSWDWHILGLLILKKVIAIVKVYLSLGLNHKIPQKRHVVLHIDNRITHHDL
jgi:hypothetical protein